MSADVVAKQGAGVADNVFMVLLLHFVMRESEFTQIFDWMVM